MASLFSLDWADVESSTGMLTVLAIAPSVACLLWFWVAYQTSPLRKYPGPFLAGICFLFSILTATS